MEPILLRISRYPYRAQFLPKLWLCASRAATWAFAILFTACAGEAPVGGTTVLDTMDRSTAQDEISISEAIAPKGPISLSFRPPDRGGTAYRLIIEITGKRATKGNDKSEKPDASGASHLLDLESIGRGCVARIRVHLRYNE